MNIQERLKISNFKKGGHQQANLIVTNANTWYKHVQVGLKTWYTCVIHCTMSYLEWFPKLKNAQLIHNKIIKKKKYPN